MQENEVATVPEPVATKTDQGVQVRKIGVTFENEERLEIIELDNATVVIAKSGLTVYTGAKGQVEHEVVLGMTFNEIRSGEKMGARGSRNSSSPLGRTELRRSII